MQHRGLTLQRDPHSGFLYRPPYLPLVLVAVRRVAGPPSYIDRALNWFFWWTPQKHTGECHSTPEAKRDSLFRSESRKLS